MEELKNNLQIEIINVADSSNKKVVSSVIKSKLGISNPTNLKYLPLDSNNIAIIYKEDLSKNKDFLNKTFNLILQIWDKLKENKQNGVVVFDINGTLNAISIIDNSFNLVLKQMEAELAILLSLYETYKTKKVSFYYEDTLIISKEFETLSNMLDIPLNYFHKLDFEEEFNLDNHLIGFSESFVMGIIEKIKKRNLSKEKNEEEEENVESASEVDTQEKYDKLKFLFIKFKGIIIALIVIAILASISFFAYIKYQEEQELERQRLIELEAKKRVSEDNQSVLISKMNKNTTIINLLNNIINKNFSVLKVKNNQIQLISINSADKLDKNPDKMLFYKKIKLNENFYKELIYINIDPKSLKDISKEEVLKIKESELSLDKFLKNGNFKDFVVNEQNSKKVSFVKEFKNKEDLLKELSGLENLNTHNIQLNIINKGISGFNLYIMFIKEF